MLCLQNSFWFNNLTRTQESKSVSFRQKLKNSVENIKMRNFVAALALLVAAASAATVSPVNVYLPPLEDTITLGSTKIIDSAVLAKDGYHYKTPRNNAISNDYLPSATKSTETVNEERKFVAVLEQNDQQDSKVPKIYLPPVKEATTRDVVELKSEQEPAESAALGENGYEYKTVRRLKYRKRRNVSEVANDYLPPTEDGTIGDVAELKSEQEPAESAALGENGYEYKTVRRLKYRKRRDVSEVANDYLPPTEDGTIGDVAELKSEQEPAESAALGENGYEYKTVRRLKYRKRRDVSEVANDYLPPTEDGTIGDVAELKSEQEPAESAALGENGYEYKTVRRLKYRKRRDVSEVANDYLPPTEDGTIGDVAELMSEQEPAESAALGENGYEYKTVRRLKYRKRRDVSEVANDYLPPTEDGTIGDVAELKSEQEPAESAALGENGYEYKTVRRLKYRKRRDVSEVANDYLPPTEDGTIGDVAELMSEQEPAESAALGENGYEYKTVRRLKYRKRRDVSEVANDYLPPTEEGTIGDVAEVMSEQEPKESAALGENGYVYKTVRRLKYRKRRDVSEVANDYLPPTEEGTIGDVAEVMSEQEPKESAALGENGYVYKTVRRLKYRKRRDVSEVANDYLPPTEDGTIGDVAEVMSEQEPAESAALGENGYEYKTVRRLKYRKRRDVFEVANDYLPPTEDGTIGDVAELKSEQEPKESAALGENGYEYKTVRRLKYRHRRQ